MSQEFLDKLKHIEGAVAHHVYEEESNWFLDLKTKTLAAEVSYPRKTHTVCRLECRSTTGCRVSPAPGGTRRTLSPEAPVSNWPRRTAQLRMDRVR